MTETNAYGPQNSGDDYLTHPTSTGRGTPIVNLLAPGCASPGTALTDSDLGYLKGLYHMRADGKLSVQQDEISYQMQQASEGN